MSCDNSDLELKSLVDDLKQAPDHDLFIKTGVSPLENNQQCIDLLRFLLDDDAFSSDFLITSILAYYEWEQHRTGAKGLGL